MTLTKTAVVLLAAGALAGTASAQLLYHPVVTLIGNGTTTASGTSQVVTIATYSQSTPSQLAPVSSAVYNNGATGQRLVNSLSATSEGSLTNNPGLSNAAALGLSFTGQGYAYSAGYDAALGTATVNGAVANANRVIGRVSLGPTQSITAPTILQSQTQGTAYSANNFRGATGSDAASNPALFGAGTSSPAANGGWRNFNTNTILAASPTNVRTVELLGNDLFGTTGSGATGIYLLDPSGASAAAAATPFITTATNVSPYEFALFNDATNPNSIRGFNTAYIADDSATQGGIQKYTYNGTGWTLSYILRETNTTYRGLAGQLDPATGLYTLFATTADGQRLVQVTDTGSSSSFLTLATAGQNFAFRGVALAIPTPGTAAILGLAGVFAARRRRA